jgi:hypothetical protein
VTLVASLLEVATTTAQVSNVRWRIDGLGSYEETAVADTRIKKGFLREMTFLK